MNDKSNNHKDIYLQKIKQTLIKLFKVYGAKEIDSPILAPVQARFCQFISKQQLINSRKHLDDFHQNNLYDSKDQ